MEKSKTISEMLLDQCARWPRLEPTDLLKALRQRAFGGGHFVTDEAEGVRRLREELAQLPSTMDGQFTEDLGGGVCRLHLSVCRETGLAPETLFRLFVLSAETPHGGGPALEEGLAALTALAKGGKLPFSAEEVEAAVSVWRAEGCPPCHHSQAFREAYAPAYRVVRTDYLWLLPLLVAIDQKMAAKDRVLVAIEGGSASGKTTLGALLADIYDCNVFHMDDFFLRPHQRTPERLTEPGGNVDRERFLEEVLAPLKAGGPVAYRRYDCHTQTLGGPAEMAPKALNIVEGAYSMHPSLADGYDLSAFLRIDPEAQRCRILRRNGAEVGARFFDTWLPLEQRYFEATDAAGRCDLILEVEA